MSRGRTGFQCRECGGISLKWTGQCPDCGAWNSLEETRTPSTTGPRIAGYAGGPAEVRRLGDLTTTDAPGRTSTRISELDRVLGGGLVPGSAILIGGDPGIGKSTLLLQLMANLHDIPGLYVTGEESPEQLSLRSHRLGLVCTDLRLLTETCVERIIDHARREQPSIMVVDSIQTIHSENLASAPGAVSQVRESAAALVRHAKQTGTALFIVGHVTKEGQIAGPRVLEHMVDTVLYFEGDAGGRYRVIRAVKNRFGAINELGVFAMQETGLKPVSNPSAIFLSRHEAPVPGSVIMVTREGTRPMLLEVQALVAQSHAPQARRLTVGLEQNRLTMLLAVLQRHGGLMLHDQDVFINVVGGIRLGETAADLPVLLAILSSFRDRALPPDLVCFGEIGLAGEIRPVPNGEERLREAAKHGFTRAVIPAANKPRQAVPGMEIIAASRLVDALEVI